MQRVRRLLHSRPASGRPLPRPLVLECLEDRCLLASGYQLSSLVSNIPGLAPVTDVQRPGGIC